MQKGKLSLSVSVKKIKKISTLSLNRGVPLLGYQKEFITENCYNSIMPADKSSALTIYLASVEPGGQTCRFSGIPLVLPLSIEILSEN